MVGSSIGWMTSATLMPPAATLAVRQLAAPGSDLPASNSPDRTQGLSVPVCLVKSMTNRLESTSKDGMIPNQSINRRLTLLIWGIRSMSEFSEILRVRIANNQ
jgi:hypothetical protein